MLDVEKGWEAFNNFENYFFTPDCEDFFQFTGKWNVRHQAAVDVGISYPNIVLAFKLLQNSNLSAPVQSRIISSLRTEFKDDCNIVHLITYLISRETQNKQNFKSVPKQVTSEQSLGCLPIDEKVDIPRELDPLYSDENIKLEYFNIEEEMVDNDKDEGVGEDVEETVTVSVNESQVYKPGTPDERDLENEGANEKENGQRKLLKTPWEYSVSDPSDVDEPVSAMPDVTMYHERASIYDSSALSEDKALLGLFGDRWTQHGSVGTSRNPTPDLTLKGSMDSLCIYIDKKFRQSEEKIDSRKLEEKMERRHLEEKMEKSIAVIENFSSAFADFQTQMRAEISRSISMRPAKATRVLRPFEIIRNLEELDAFNENLWSDKDHYEACKIWLDSCLEGDSVYNTAYKILPKVMSLEFLKTISWSAGHGTNRTSKPIILKEFQHIVGLVKDVIQNSKKWKPEFEMSGTKASGSLKDGLSKYLRNLSQPRKEPNNEKPKFSKVRERSTSPGPIQKKKAQNVDALLRKELYGAGSEKSMTIGSQALSGALRHNVKQHSKKNSAVSLNENIVSARKRGLHEPAPGSRNKAARVHEIEKASGPDGSHKSAPGSICQAARVHLHGMTAGAAGPFDMSTGPIHQPACVQTEGYNPREHNVIGHIGESSLTVRYNPRLSFSQAIGESNKTVRYNPAFKYPPQQNFAADTKGYNYEEHNEIGHIGESRETLRYDPTFSFSQGIGEYSEDLGRTDSTPEEPSLERKPLLTSTGNLAF